MTQYFIIFIILFYSSIASSTDKLCPDDMVFTGTSCIDRFEWPNKRGEKPLLSVSGIKENLTPDINAEELCNSVGKRICVKEEWFEACKGLNNSIYPYGNKPEETSCNTNKYWKAVDERKVALRDPKTLIFLDQSEPAGSREKCVSASGAYDMVGNAEEWVKCQKGKFGWCLVGGYWASGKAASCKYTITKHAPNWHYNNQSFRCCLDIKH